MTPHVPAPLRLIGVLVLAGLWTACGERSAGPSTAACDNGATDLRALTVFQGTTVRGAALECIRLAGDANYIVIPQMLGEDLPYVYQPFLIGDPKGTIVEQSLAVAPTSAVSAASMQDRLHELVRAHEPRYAERTARPSARVMASAVDADHREFSVLAKLTEPLTFARVAATLQYDGSRVLIYVDDRAASAYTATELAALGAFYNDVLYPIDHDAFGAASDVDGNGRIIVLLTPAVNALVSASECATFGFATGFFFGFDLASTTPESNRVEIFYALTPDPDGSYSCPHSKSEVNAMLPATFIHELQHMISYGQRVIGQGSRAEVPWLNEGLSHVAEELGARYFEAKYPPPSGRTQPSQLFPDSAAALVIGDLFNSYRFLRFSQQYSIISCAPGSFCSTPERGAAWLFLRWLSDVRGDAQLYTKLVQSALQGTQNVEQVAGEPFEALFGDFAIALWADSLEGYPRTSVAARHRFASRNLRRLYSALYDAVGPLGGIPQRFPISPLELEIGTRRRSAMRPGSLQVFRMAASNRSEFALSFTADDGIPLRSDQRAQLSILRIR